MTDNSKLTLPADRRHPAGRHPKAPPAPEPYVATDELTTAVNLAVYLRRPLLLEGDAGCGKSRLARHIAYELGLPLYESSMLITRRVLAGGRLRRRRQSWSRQRPRVSLTSAPRETSTRSLAPASSSTGWRPCAASVD